MRWTCSMPSGSQCSVAGCEWGWHTTSLMPSGACAARQVVPHAYGLYQCSSAKLRRLVSWQGCRRRAAWRASGALPLAWFLQPAQPRRRLVPEAAGAYILM